MYPVGSRVQVVCKQGYNITLKSGRNDQIITCDETGWLILSKYCLICQVVVG